MILETHRPARTNAGAHIASFAEFRLDLRQIAAGQAFGRGARAWSQEPEETTPVNSGPRRHQPGPAPGAYRGGGSAQVRPGAAWASFCGSTGVGSKP